MKEFIQIVSVYPFAFFLVFLCFMIAMLVFGATVHEILKVFKK